MSNAYVINPETGRVISLKAWQKLAQEHLLSPPHYYDYPGKRWRNHQNSIGNSPAYYLGPSNQLVEYPRHFSYNPYEIPHPFPYNDIKVFNPDSGRRDMKLHGPKWLELYDDPDDKVLDPVKGIWVYPDLQAGQKLIREYGLENLSRESDMYDFHTFVSTFDNYYSPKPTMFQRIHNFFSPPMNSSMDQRTTSFSPKCYT